MNPNNKNIYFIGMPGSGKSELGKYFAEKNQRDFYDLDDVFQAQVKMTITEFVKQNSWDRFAEKESEILKAYCTKKNTVFSTGGRVVMRKDNCEILKTGIVIFLSVDLETLKKRVSKKVNTHRPTQLAKNIAEEIEERWNLRKNYYQQCADITIDATEQTNDLLFDLEMKYKEIQHSLASFSNLN